MFLVYNCLIKFKHIKIFVFVNGTYSVFYTFNPQYSSFLDTNMQKRTTKENRRILYTQTKTKYTTTTHYRQLVTPFITIYINDAINAAIKLPTNVTLLSSVIITGKYVLRKSKNMLELNINTNANTTIVDL